MSHLKLRRSRREFLVWKCARVNEFQNRVAEQIRILSVVEAPLKFIEVAVEMLFRNLMERADDGPLEQAERALDGVRVNVAAHVFLRGVLHRFVLRVVVA